MVGSADWITTMATHLAHLQPADETSIWAAIPAVFAEVMDESCDQTDAYHGAIAGAVVTAVRSSNRERCIGVPRLGRARGPRGESSPGFFEEAFAFLR